MGWEGCLLVRWHVQSRVQQQLEVPKGCTSGSIWVGYTHEEPKNLMTRWPLLFYQYIPAAGLIHTEAQCSQGCMQHINSVACKQWIVLVRWRQWFRMLTTSDLVHCYEFTIIIHYHSTFRVPPLEFCRGYGDRGLSSNIAVPSVVMHSKSTQKAGLEAIQGHVVLHVAPYNLTRWVKTKCQMFSTVPTPGT